MEATKTTITPDEVVDEIESMAHPEKEKGLYFSMLKFGARPRKRLEILYAGQQEEITPEQALAQAGVPPAVSAKMGDLREPIPASVRSWANELAVPGNSYPWLWLKGGSGAGKTCDACWVIGECVTKRSVVDAQFVTAQRLSELWDAGDLYGANSKAERIKQYRQAALLVIDGLGEEEATRSTLNALWAVISERHENMLPTCFTSQLSGSDIRDRLDVFDAHKSHALMSRIMDALQGFNGSFITLTGHVVELENDDLREAV